MKIGIQNKLDEPLSPKERKLESFLVLDSYRYSILLEVPPKPVKNKTIIFSLY
jgi:hypothetical protein